MPAATLLLSLQLKGPVLPTFGVAFPTSNNLI